MPTSADKFSRLAALRPARSVPSPPAALRAPDREDSLAHLLCASVAKNHFGEHLTIRNWFSTPGFSEPSAVALELLSRTRDHDLFRSPVPPSKTPRSGSSWIQKPPASPAAP